MSTYRAPARGPYARRSLRADNIDPRQVAVSIRPRTFKICETSKSLRADCASSASLDTSTALANMPNVLSPTQAHSNWCVAAVTARLSSAYPPSGRPLRLSAIAGRGDRGSAPAAKVAVSSTHHRRGSAVGVAALVVDRELPVRVERPAILRGVQGDWRSDARSSPPVSHAGDHRRAAAALDRGAGLSRLLGPSVPDEVIVPRRPIIARRNRRRHRLNSPVSTDCVARYLSTRHRIGGTRRRGRSQHPEPELSEYAERRQIPFADRRLHPRLGRRFPWSSYGPSAAGRKLTAVSSRGVLTQFLGDQFAKSMSSRSPHASCRIPSRQRGHRVGVQLVARVSRPSRTSGAGCSGGGVAPRRSKEGGTLAARSSRRTDDPPAWAYLSGGQQAIGSRSRDPSRLIRR